MERIRTPQENPSGENQQMYLCASLTDLLESRDEIFNAVLSQEKRDTGIRSYYKIGNPFFTFSINPVKSETLKETHASVIVPGLEHNLDADKTVELEPDEITLWDGLRLLKVKLPNTQAIDKRNKIRAEKGQSLISIDQLRAAWSADVALLASYSVQDVYKIIDVFGNDLPEPEATSEKGQTKLHLLPQANAI